MGQVPAKTRKRNPDEWRVVLSTSQPHLEMRSSPHGWARRGVQDLGSTIDLEEITRGANVVLRGRDAPTDPKARGAQVAQHSDWFN
jgi:hypothetical protein